MSGIFTLELEVRSRVVIDAGKVAMKVSIYIASFKNPWWFYAAILCGSTTKVSWNAVFS